MERLSLDACLEYFYEIDQNQNIEHDALNDAEYCRRICEQGNFVIFIVKFTCNLMSLITKVFLKYNNLPRGGFYFLNYLSDHLRRGFYFLNYLSNHLKYNKRLKKAH